MSAPLTATERAAEFVRRMWQDWGHAYHDTLLEPLAEEFAAAEAEAARAQFEHDCAAVCRRCRAQLHVGIEKQYRGEMWCHGIYLCDAHDIRAAFAAQHAERGGEGER